MYIYIKKIIFGLFFFGLFSMIIDTTFAERDIMDIMFEPSKSYEKIIDLGSTKNAVGNNVFRESTQIGFEENLGYGCFVGGQHITKAIVEGQKNEAGYQGSIEDFCSKVLGGDRDVHAISTEQKAPLIVRITKFLLRLTIILSITMVLYNSLFWIIESAKGGDVKNAKDNIIYIIGGILLALSSVALINLISSITLSSLHVSAGAGCNINGTNIPKGDQLKEFICKEYFRGDWNQNKIGNRCKINGKWENITNTQQMKKCIELGGDFINN